MGVGGAAREAATASGPVQGVVEGGLLVFRGVPFAAPPVGELRFAAPRPPRSWELLEATSFGPVPPQPSTGIDGPDDEFVDGRGWLTANVWTPDMDGCRPVMVWVHGGAYRRGSSADPLYDGAVLAAEGDVVVVTFNYRVGVEGFGLIEGVPPNRGLLDQIAALGWVRDNIAAFGGDPQQVTVFGESAGAGSIAALLAMPRATGLFRRAILQSVPGTFFSHDLAADIMATIAAQLGREPRLEDLCDVPPDELVAAGDSVVMRDHRDRWGVVADTRTPYSPVVDGDVLPSAPWQALRDGASREVDLIVGHNRDEYRLFLAEDGLLGRVSAETVDETLAAFAPDAAAFRRAFPDHSPEQLYELVRSDWLFRMPSLHIARHHQGRSYLYELALPAPARGGALGACHGLDTALIFGTFTAPFATMLLGDHPPTPIVTAATAMRRAWSAFARGDHPGWPDHHGTGLAWILDDTPVIGRYPEQVSVRLWSDHHFDALPAHRRTATHPASRTETR